MLVIVLLALAFAGVGAQVTGPASECDFSDPSVTGTDNRWFYAAQDIDPFTRAPLTHCPDARVIKCDQESDVFYATNYQTFNREVGGQLVGPTGIRAVSCSALNSGSVGGVDVGLGNINSLEIPTKLFFNSLQVPGDGCNSNAFNPRKAFWCVYDVAVQHISPCKTITSYSLQAGQPFDQTRCPALAADNSSSAFRQVWMAPVNAEMYDYESMSPGKGAENMQLRFNFCALQPARPGGEADLCAVRQNGGSCPNQVSCVPPVDLKNWISGTECYCSFPVPQVKMPADAQYTINQPIDPWTLYCGATAASGAALPPSPPGLAYTTLDGTSDIYPPHGISCPPPGYIARISYPNRDEIDLYFSMDGQFHSFETLQSNGITDTNPWKSKWVGFALDVRNQRVQNEPLNLLYVGIKSLIRIPRDDFGSTSVGEWLHWCDNEMTRNALFDSPYYSSVRNYECLYVNLASEFRTPSEGILLNRFVGLQVNPATVLATAPSVTIFNLVQTNINCFWFSNQWRANGNLAPLEEFIGGGGDPDCTQPGNNRVQYCGLNAEDDSFLLQLDSDASVEQLLTDTCRCALRMAYHVEGSPPTNLDFLVPYEGCCALSATGTGTAGDLDGLLSGFVGRRNDFCHIPRTSDVDLWKEYFGTRMTLPSQGFSAQVVQAIENFYGLNLDDLAERRIACPPPEVLVCDTDNVWKAQGLEGAVNPSATCADLSSATITFTLAAAAWNPTNGLTQFLSCRYSVDDATSDYTGELEMRVQFSVSDVQTTGVVLVTQAGWTQLTTVLFACVPNDNDVCSCRLSEYLQPDNLQNKLGRPFLWSECCDNNELDVPCLSTSTARTRIACPSQNELACSGSRNSGSDRITTSFLVASSNARGPLYFETDVNPGDCTGITPGDTSEVTCYDPSLSSSDCQQFSRINTARPFAVRGAYNVGTGLPICEYGFVDAPNELALRLKSVPVLGGISTQMFPVGGNPDCTTTPRIDPPSQCACQWDCSSAETAYENLIYQDSQSLCQGVPIPTPTPVPVPVPVSSGNRCPPEILLYCDSKGWRLLRNPGYWQFDQTSAGRPCPFLSTTESESNTLPIMAGLAPTGNDDDVECTYLIQVPPSEDPNEYVELKLRTLDQNAIVSASNDECISANAYLPTPTGSCTCFSDPLNTECTCLAGGTGSNTVDYTFSYEDAEQRDPWYYNTQCIDKRENVVNATGGLQQICPPPGCLQCKDSNTWSAPGYVQTQLSSNYDARTEAPKCFSVDPENVEIAATISDPVTVWGVMGESFRTVSLECSYVINATGCPDDSLTGDFPIVEFTLTSVKVMSQTFRGDPSTDASCSPAPVGYTCTKPGNCRAPRLGSPPDPDAVGDAVILLQVDDPYVLPPWDYEECCVAQDGEGGDFLKGYNWVEKCVNSDCLGTTARNTEKQSCDIFAIPPPPPTPSPAPTPTPAPTPVPADPFSFNCLEANFAQQVKEVDLQSQSSRTGLWTSCPNSASWSCDGIVLELGSANYERTGSANPCVPSFPVNPGNICTDPVIPLSDFQLIRAVASGYDAFGGGSAVTCLYEPPVSDLCVVTIESVSGANYAVANPDEPTWIFTGNPNEYQCDLPSPTGQEPLNSTCACAYQQDPTNAVNDALTPGCAPVGITQVTQRTTCPPADFVELYETSGVKCIRMTQDFGFGPCQDPSNKNPTCDAQNACGISGFASSLAPGTQMYFYSANLTNGQLTCAYTVSFQEGVNFAPQVKFTSEDSYGISITQVFPNPDGGQLNWNQTESAVPIDANAFCGSSDAAVVSGLLNAGSYSACLCPVFRGSKRTNPYDDYRCCVEGEAGWQEYIACPAGTSTFVQPSSNGAITTRCPPPDCIANNCYDETHTYMEGSALLVPGFSCSTGSSQSGCTCPDEDVIRNLVFADVTLLVSRADFTTNPAEPVAYGQIDSCNYMHNGAKVFFLSSLETDAYTIPITFNDTSQWTFEPYGIVSCASSNNNVCDCTLIRGSNTMLPWDEPECCVPPTSTNHCPDTCRTNFPTPTPAPAPTPAPTPTPTFAPTPTPPIALPERILNISSSTTCPPAGCLRALVAQGFGVTVPNFPTCFLDGNPNKACVSRPTPYAFADFVSASIIVPSLADSRQLCSYLSCDYALATGQTLTLQSCYDCDLPGQVQTTGAYFPDVREPGNWDFTVVGTTVASCDAGPYEECTCTAFRVGGASTPWDDCEMCSTETTRALCDQRTTFRDGRVAFLDFESVCRIDSFPPVPPLPPLSPTPAPLPLPAPAPSPSPSPSPAPVPVPTPGPAPPPKGLTECPPAFLITYSSNGFEIPNQNTWQCDPGFTNQGCTVEGAIERNSTLFAQLQLTADADGVATSVRCNYDYSAEIMECSSLDFILSFVATNPSDFAGAPGTVTLCDADAADNQDVCHCPFNRTRGQFESWAKCCCTEIIDTTCVAAGKECPASPAPRETTTSTLLALSALTLAILSS